MSDPVNTIILASFGLLALAIASLAALKGWRREAWMNLEGGDERILRAADILLWAEAVPPGSYAARVLGRGTRLRLVDPDSATRTCRHVPKYMGGSPAGKSHRRQFARADHRHRRTCASSLRALASAISLPFALYMAIARSSSRPASP